MAMLTCGHAAVPLVLSCGLRAAVVGRAPYAATLYPSLHALLKDTSRCIGCQV